MLEFAAARFDAGEIGRAETAAGESLEAFIAVDDLGGAARAFRLMGSCDHELGDLNRALERFMKALELARSVGDPSLEAASLTDIGEILTESGERREALSYFLEAAEVLKSQRTEDAASGAEEGGVLLSIGQTLSALGETENAAGYLELALDAAERNASVRLESRACLSLGVLERRRGNAQAFGALIERGVRAARVDGAAPIVVDALLARAELRIETGDSSGALEDLGEVERDAVRSGSKRKLAECYRLRSLIHERNGESAAALADFKRYHQTEDSIADERVARLVQSAEVRNQLAGARQEAEIYRLRNVELKEHRKELELTNARLRAVAEIGKEIASSLDTETIARTVYERLTELIDVFDFCLAVRNDHAHTLEFRLFMQDGRRLEPFAVPDDSPDSLAVWALKHGDPIRLDDAATEYLRFISSDRLKFGAETASIIYCPLFLEGRPIGVLGVQSPRKGAYTEEDVELLSALGTFTAIALENSRIHAELGTLNAALQAEKAELERMTRRVSHIANHDGLTGLPNRLLLSELLAGALVRADRSKKKVAVMYLDLDDFKPINDAYGHMAGDLALVVVSERLKRALRASDTVARVGGDEFIAIAAEIEGERTAATVAEKLGKACRRPMDIAGAECRVGVSIGIALYPDDGATGEELLRRADEALYAVKRGAKNGFIFSKDLREQKGRADEPPVGP